SAESVLKNPADAAKYLENKIQTWLNHPAALPHPSTGGELNYTLICGRYEGIDQRVIDAYNMLEISIGDYVLSGGEVAAQVFVDSCVRLCDNVVGGGSAATENESFEIGGLEWPLYTRPSVWRGQSVPEVLLSGHHGNIERWRKQQSDAITKERRPDLIKGNENEHN
ncbi:MAG: tRNA (guanosine(37)-N1)-methyltransferase TrmD, partial [Rickettsiales bacterium]|nr:tRNA (guanosine(37)-N1)-methyltransferase TrmD [Rickettsiales bacterium]